MAAVSANPNKIDVRIENPLPGWRAETSLKRARRLERAGRAVFTSACSIRFVDSAECVADKVARVEERQRKARTAAAYDRLADSQYYLEHARHIPLIHPQRMRVRDGR